MSKIALLSSVCVAALTVIACETASASDPTPRPVSPQRQWYVSGFGGWAKANPHKFDFVSNTTGASFRYAADLDRGNVYGGAVGVVINPNVRIEVEVAQTRGLDFGGDYASSIFIGRNPSGSMTLTTAMLNAWVSMPLGFVSPYIGGGVGWGRAKADLTITNGALRQFDGSDTGLAMQFGAGLRFPLGNNFERLDAGYRLKSVRDVSFESAIPGFHTSESTENVHTFQLGMTYKF